MAVRNEPGAKLGLNETDAALGISEMVDENMSNAARTHAIEWGKGLTGRTLVAFGGSAPIHAARLADKLALDRYLIPADAGVGSAIGFLLAPISYEVVRSRYMRLSAFDAGVVGEVVAEMRAEATGVVASGAPGSPTTGQVRAYMRYVGQGHEIGVEVPPEVVAGTASVGVLREAFDTAYRAVYGRVIPGLDVEVLSWTLVVTAVSDAASAGTVAGRMPQPRAVARPVQMERLRPPHPRPSAGPNWSMGRQVGRSRPPCTPAASWGRGCGSRDRLWSWRPRPPRSSPGGGGRSYSPAATCWFAEAAIQPRRFPV